MIRLCEYCQVAMIERVATESEPYRYDLSGLKDVLLFGIKVLQCPACGFEAPIVPRVAELHEVIARIIIQKPVPLRGEEIRFLRKHAGFPARKFATLLGVSPVYLSRVENGHTAKLGNPTDRLVRALTLTARDGRAAKDMLMQLAVELEAQTKQVRHPMFKNGRRWQAVRPRAA